MMTRSFMEVLPPASTCYSSSNWLLGQRAGGGSGGWTIEENKRFEDALAKIDIGSPNCWEWVAELIPGKTPRDVLAHYQELEKDVIEIEAGRVPCHSYGLSPPSSSSFTLDWENNYSFDGLKQSYCTGGKRSGGRTADQERKKGVPWTEEEHKLFLLGLKKYGKGDWRNIARNFVITRTPTQVASHAQKYFIRLNSGGKDKRRSSIHDITTANLQDTRPLSPSNPSTITTQSSSATTTQTLSGQFSMSVDSKKSSEAASAFDAPIRANQYMQSQPRMNPYRMKLQAQSSQIGTLHGSLATRSEYAIPGLMK